MPWVTLHALVTTALHDPSIVGWDVGIYNPDIDRNHAHAPRIVELLEAGAAALCER